ncbi:hypothetical protein [Glycomyces sp. NPDC048151]|uniref:hypothetical protein n=1 Tax=Glycomyces sp. NPDC048151 TaxID=3364002 RepID=UPI0037167659
MRNTTMVAASAVAAAAAAALSGGAASASTPDWLTVANVDSEHDTTLPSVCETGETGPLADTACGSLFSADTEGTAETFGHELPESPAGYGMPALANVDLRDFAKWQICGVAVASSIEPAECDNSIPGPKEPVGPGSGISLVNAETAGAFHWSVCGIAVAQAGEATDC